jgi:hypothetical protein
MVWLLFLLFQADQFQVEVVESTSPAFVVDVPGSSSPSIEFRSAPVAAKQKPYFVLYFADNCGGCIRMKNDKIEDALKQAGYLVRTINISTDPQGFVTVAPEVWLCDPSREPIRKWKGYTTAKSLLTPVVAEGLCRLSSNGRKWSGVAIGDGLILTVAHHEQEDGFFAEFPVGFGSSDYVRVPAELVKSDVDADLSVLRFEAPELAEIKEYQVSDLAANAIEIPGYLSGESPKRVKIRKKNMAMKIAGIAIDSYDGEGISSPQIGMSGSPLLTPDRRIAGIQAIGTGAEIGAVTVDTIRGFLADVDRKNMPPVAATIHGAQLNPEVIAAALAAHIAKHQGVDPPAFGSLFDITIDTPDSARGWIADMLTKQSVEFPSAGVSAQWGGDRTISIAPGKLRISPGAIVSVKKFGVSVTTTLTGVTFADDLRWVTLELKGVPDLTVRFE